MLDATDYLEQSLICHQLTVILEKHQISGKSRPLIMVIEDDEIFRDYLIMLFQNQEWIFYELKMAMWLLNISIKNNPI